MKMINIYGLIRQSLRLISVTWKRLEFMITVNCKALEFIPFIPIGAQIIQAISHLDFSTCN